MLNEISYSAASKHFKTGQYTEALSTLNQLIDTKRDARTYALLAKTCLRIGMPEQAATSYELAYQQDGMDAESYLVESIKLYFDCGQKDKALALSNKLIHKFHKYPDITYIVGTVLLERGEPRIARALKNILMKSDTIEHIKLGARIAITTWDLFDPKDIETARLLLAKLPRQQAVRLMYLVFCREHSKFDAIEKHQPIIDAAVAAGDTSFISLDGTFFNIHWSDNEHINQLARSNTPAFTPEMTAKRHQMPHEWGQKIRIGYLSSDLFDKHATMKLIRRVLELHDRDRFEVTLFCHSDPDLLKTNQADRALWGNVVTIRDMTNEEALAEIKARNIDILVDLKGHTAGNRTAILNMGAAPVQVAWIGFPGSTVNVDLDYVIGDHHVLPDSSKPHYYEKFVRLPDSYQPNDPINRPLAKQISRGDVGLPEDAFVFASFNANRKITPRTVELWCDILKRAPNSVIWILHNSQDSKTNILAKFIAMGISAKRVFFMGKLEFELHLNRITVADLGLDTFPVNGHTTTSEQLWSGLPVLTIKGTNFASRVSESLLHAIGTPELIAENEAAYVDQAVAHALDPSQLKEIRARINANRFTSPLFDAERYCRHLEAAYETMSKQAKAGKAPDHFDVPALPARTEPFLVR
ncbi:glycosyltransferase family 41 protein [Agrobacterium rosae]|uniref:Glycosyl transferase n=1 Tax=Agrobacterium rosae TaxID=1972867 RepID=A0AAE5VMQ5_9HYPH|nr:glycosyltransferase family 41 protein [Agrobacterium rosae]KAA3514027.1 glycosyl transferase [Agrobacterium rosae]KAA3522694.1 glycosyl transferase [Agrobacterium rosae]MCM2434045.1 glycosyl transferase [Agrobacterium rosae]MDX8330397.1 glycosyl transferase [Agrobacterium rosae]MQB47357.1 glycosyl transferase [Agrobacterium rosae]